MFYTAGNYTSDIHQSEEIVQECLEKLIEKTSTLRKLSPPALACYVVTATRNTAINQQKQKSRRQQNILELDPKELENLNDGSLPLDELIITKTEIEHLKSKWPMLDPESRYLLEGKYILGYDNDALSKMLNCQPNSVRMKLTRARRKLIKLLKETTLDGKA